MTGSIASPGIKRPKSPTGSPRMRCNTSQGTASSRAALAALPQFAASEVRILERLQNSKRPHGGDPPEPLSSPAPIFKAEHCALGIKSTSWPRLDQSSGGRRNSTRRRTHEGSFSLKRKRSLSPLAADFVRNTMPMPSKASAPTARDARSVSEEEEHVEPEDAKTQKRQQTLERKRAKWLSKLPAGINPEKPELLGFDAGHASTAERAEYFYEKRKKDLMSILSFCDQVKPQLLVDVLVSVSKKHPDLLIFDDPDWKLHLPSRAASPKVTQRDQSAGSPQELEPAPPPLPPSPPPPPQKEIRRPRGRPRLVKPMAEASPARANATVESDTKSVIDVVAPVLAEPTLPPTWPKAGEGLYSELLPEDEDMEYLADENDGEAFSHFLVSKSGRQVVMTVCG